MTHEPGHTDWLVQSFQKCFSYKKLIRWRRRSTQNIIFVKRKRQIWFESVSFKSSILCSQFCDFQTFEIIFFKRTSHRPFQRTEPVKWKSEIAIAQMRFSSAFCVFNDRMWFGKKSLTRFLFCSKQPLAAEVNYRKTWDGFEAKISGFFAKNKEI